MLLAKFMNCISGNEIGPFRAIEESIVAQLTLPENRSDIYAWYSLSGLMGAAFGFIICGWVLQYFSDVLRWDLLSSYRAIFVIYAAIGILKLGLTIFLSPLAESEKKQKQTNGSAGRNDEATPLISDNGQDDVPEVPPQVTSQAKKGLRALLPDISRESISVVSILCVLFGLDALGTGVNPL